MINAFPDSTNPRLLQQEKVWLEQNDFDQAAKICKQVTGEVYQWQTYLNVLALRAFKRWLSERVADIRINCDNCSALKPKYANLIEAVCNLKMGEFNLCLIAKESVWDEVVSVPKAAVDLPEFAAHFYVVMEVQEEEEQVIIRGFLRHDQLVHYQQSVNLQVEQDWSYQLPLSLFNEEPDYLLHYWRWLELTAIDLPVDSEYSVIPSLKPDEFLKRLLSGLKSPQQRLWQIVTWEQGKIILQSPELVDLLYQWQTEQATQEQTERLATRIGEVLTLLSQLPVNVALWLQDRIDDSARSLGWERPSPLKPANGWRSTRPFDLAIAQLKNRGVKIPDDARGSCRAIELDGTPIEIFAGTWCLPQKSTEQTAATQSEKLPEAFQNWSLVLILKRQTSGRLPQGIKLQIRNQTEILCEKTLESMEFYLISDPVEGSLNERFFVTLTLDGDERHLHPFVFQPA